MRTLSRNFREKRRLGISQWYIVKFPFILVAKNMDILRPRIFFRQSEFVENQQLRVQKYTHTNVPPCSLVRCRLFDLARIFCELFPSRSWSATFAMSEMQFSSIEHVRMNDRAVCGRRESTSWIWINWLCAVMFSRGVDIGVRFRNWCTRVCVCVLSSGLSLK